MAQLLVAQGAVGGEPGVDGDPGARVGGQGDEPAGVQGGQGVGDVVGERVAAVQPVVTQFGHAATVDPPQSDPVVEISSGQ